MVIVLKYSCTYGLYINLSIAIIRESVEISILS